MISFHTTPRILILLTFLSFCWGMLDSYASPAQDLEQGRRQIPVAKDANIIVISFDALRADALGIYGSQRPATPTMDAFAESGVIFEQAYSAAPVTPTSFAGFFSGMWPPRVLQGWQLKTNTTLAGLLTKAGYLSAAILNNVHLTPERGFGRGFQQYDWRRNDPDEKVLQDTKQWLRQNANRKFFLWVHFLRPHAPYIHRPEAGHLYQQKKPGAFEVTTGVHFEVTNAQELERVKDLYYGEVWTADQLFGDLLQEIRKLGLDQRSVIVLTADHGEEFHEHGGLQHGELYQEHLRVPLILSIPRLQDGIRLTAPARTIDLLPTLLSVVGHPLETPVDGVDWSWNTEPVPVLAFSMAAVSKLAVSLLEGSHKLLLRCRQNRKILELYNLESDPGEQHNIASPETTQTIRQYLRRLSSILEARPCLLLTNVMGGVGVTHEMDTESIEALRALGYVD